MGEIAEAMLTGIMCAQCGEYLDCDVCAATEIPMYCSEKCARDSGEEADRACKHSKNRGRY